MLVCSLCGKVSQQRVRSGKKPQAQTASGGAGAAVLLGISSSSKVQLRDGLQLDRVYARGTEWRARSEVSMSAVLR